MLVELSDGVRLRTYTSGTPSAAPPVVLLHGGPGLWDYLEPIADLIEGRVVHRFDQRGCGGSDPSDEQTMQRLRDDIEELRLHWGYEQDRCHRPLLRLHARPRLRRGVPGQRRARRLPRRPGAGRLANPVPRRAGSADDARAAGAARRTGRPEAKPGRGNRVPRAVLVHRSRRSRAGLEMGAWRMRPSPIRSTSPPTARSAPRPVPGPTKTAPGPRPRSPQPVWFVHGDGDPRPASAVQELAKHVAQHEFRLIEGAGHSLYRERPDATRDVLAEIVG